jgi:hypothetical protein
MQSMCFLLKDSVQITTDDELQTLAVPGKFSRAIWLELLAKIAARGHLFRRFWGCTGAFKRDG